MNSTSDNARKVQSQQDPYDNKTNLKVICSQINRLHKIILEVGVREQAASELLKSNNVQRHEMKTRLFAIEMSEYQTEQLCIRQEKGSFQQNGLFYCFRGEVNSRCSNLYDRNNQKYGLRLN